MHHSPAPAPLPERLARSLTRFLDLTVRFLRPARPGLRHRGGRLALGAVVSTVLTALVLSVPMVSGAEDGTPFVALDSFAATSAARTTEGESPVVMGRDGRAVPSTGAAATSTSSAPAGRSSTGTVAGPATTAPAPTPAAPVDAAAAPAPAESTDTSTATSTPTVAEDASAAAPATVAAAHPAEPGDEGEVLALVNVQRAAAGCEALAADAALASVARAHSADMRDRHFFDHVNPDGLDASDRAALAGLKARAENIAHGQPDPAAVMEEWMDTPGQRANILDCSLTRLGVGVAEGAGGPWWTQLFA